MPDFNHLIQSKIAKSREGGETISFLFRPNLIGQHSKSKWKPGLSIS